MLTSKLHNRLILILFLVFAYAAVGQCKVIYVKTTGNDSSNGSSWAAAKKTIQAGISASVSGGQVWVAGGTYYENITVKSGVAVYGGFAGNAANPLQRDANAWPSIIDGKQLDTVVTFPSGVTGTTRIDGFVIKNGNAENGGGIYCNSYCSPTIVNNAILWNTANTDGGGIFLTGDSAPNITNNVISGNLAGSGGGISIYGCNDKPCNIANNIIGFNSADGGGAISCDVSSLVNITNNTIVANSSNEGNGVVSLFDADPIIANNIIYRNSAGFSGSHSSPILHNNCVYENLSYNYSGFMKGTSDISVDPKIVSLSFSNLHIQPNSPCRDAGYDGVIQPGCIDMDGQVRILGAHVDIGADESDGILWTATPKIVRVSTTGNDSNNGSSWALAKRTVQAAIDDACLQSGEVWVAAGTYFENITLRQCAYLYGGFGGTETLRSQRKPSKFHTILDGKQAGSVVVITAGYLRSAIDGFDITNGKAEYGGGILCSYSAFSTISNNRIYNNIAENEDYYGYGGGISCLEDSSPIITGNSIYKNLADGGAGIACLDNKSSSIICRNWICENIANDSGAGICCYYGTVDVKDNVIVDNFAAENGGGIYFYDTNAAILNNTILGNTAVDGSGIYTYKCKSGIANNIIAFNNNGGLFCEFFYDEIPGLYNNCLYENGMYNYSGMPPGVGDIEADPKFFSRTFKDFRLAINSPCVDAGKLDFVANGDLDIDATPRVSGGKVDIGAYELNINHPPVIISLTPNSGTITANVKQTFAAVYSDSAKYTNLAECYMIINATLSKINGVYVTYNANTNLLYLRNDANTSWGTGYALGSAKVLENSQCKLYCAETTKSGSGNNLTVNWKIEIKPSMAGKICKAWLYANDDEGMSSGWTLMGEFDVFTPQPTITSFAPASGGAGTKVTITGTNFTGATSVKMAGVAATSFTVVSATSITFVVPKTSTGRISVITPGGTALSVTPFTFIAAPIITSFTPTSGGAGTKVTIKGTKFTGATAVKFSGVAATSFTVASAKTITAIAPKTATGKVSVTTPGGTAVSSALFYTAPTITSFTPALVGAGTKVTIIGDSFTGATAVKFNGVAAASFTVVSATSITAIAPKTTSGKISVTTPGGTAVSATLFTFVPIPKIISFTPTSGVVKSKVTITGNNFIGVKSVKFNGIACRFTVVNAALITAKMPASRPIIGKISVITPGGTATSATSFTVISSYTGQMIKIPAGSFLMGELKIEYSESTETPRHSVTLPDYYIGKYEVTRGEYRAFMNAGGYSEPSYWSADGWKWKVENNITEPFFWKADQNWYGNSPFTQTDNHPVIGVTYYEAEAFCNWAGGHLPTEAQWEKAARWTGTRSNVYPWGDIWNAERCNSWDDHNSAGGGYNQNQTAPVGSYPSGASYYGCQDMAGNVEEMCQDWYKSYPGSINPFDFTNRYRALRGGSWDGDYYSNNYFYCRSAYRSCCEPSDSSIDIGFRLAR